MGENRNRKLIVAIFFNFFITGSQILGGLISGSLSLLSDALHNLSDVIALSVSLFASLISVKRQTVTKTFGYKRAEIIAAFINSLILIIISVFLGYEAITRLTNIRPITSVWVISMSVLGIVVNWISAKILHADAHENINIKSAYVHLLSDMFTSVAVLVGGLLMYYFNIYWIDSVLTFLIAIYLIYMAVNILLKSVNVLMLFTPSNIILENISSSICSLPEVLNIHHVHVWQLNDKQIHFEAHVDLHENVSLQKVNEILEKIRFILHEKFEIDHVTLQPEFNICDKKDLIIQGH